LFIGFPHDDYTTIPSNNIKKDGLAIPWLINDVLSIPKEPIHNAPFSLQWNRYPFCLFVRHFIENRIFKLIVEGDIRCNRRGVNNDQSK
jgi:hypothetical protein